MKNNSVTPYLQALIAALLFGASAPLAKLLLGNVEAVPLAGFLYLGSGLGVLLIMFFRKPDPQGERLKEARLQRSDWPWLLGAISSGGVAAPIILMVGLSTTPAATASLLLNFESVATTLIAAVVFKEAVDRRVWLAVLVITIASILLSVDLQAAWGITPGALAVLAACFFWGIDNNFTNHIAAKDPLTIVAIKGIAAGSFSLILALILGKALPGWTTILGAMLLGCMSYGFSIVLFIRAMRGLGAARTSALFATAPAAGILLSLALFQESPGWLFVASLPLMAVGTYFLLNEDHQHTHDHAAVQHDHWHQHDDQHHDHTHEGLPNLPLAHAHAHQHESLTHQHAHTPDTDHRHTHS